MQPPSTLGHRVLAGGILVAGQGMRHQYGVRLGRIELAVRLVGDAKGAEQLVAVEPQWLRCRNVDELAARPVGFEHARIARKSALVDRIHKRC